MTDAGERIPAIRVMMMPRDTNANGTIFGGVLLSYIDQAGAIEARAHAAHRYVTVAVDRVEFRAPVYVGDVLSFRARLVRVGRTSVTVQVTVEAERFHDPRMVVRVTEAQLVYVAVDDERRPAPVAVDAD
ncbi:MAG: acyl-CoA thioesterase [Planctomycetes bacterium]|nr:acyl-CoA thioesterase [Planctomycetota bacterium]